MTFTYQQSVGLYNKTAIAGDRANQQEVIYTPINLVTPADLGTAVAVKVGNFAWRKGADQAVGAGTGAPVGFVERVQNYQYYDVTDEGTLVVPQGASVELAVKGDFFVQADATTSAGATVYANTSNGAATLTSGASTVDTGFKTWNATTSGGMAIITKR
jgi:hypothetical protein